MEEILKKLPLGIREKILRLPKGVQDCIEEIRIGVGRPMIVIAGGREYVMGSSLGDVSTKYDKELVNTILNTMVSFSLHAVQDQLIHGYITLPGGHRVGVCGKTVIDQGKIVAVKDITSFNIRRSREIKGISNVVMPYIYKDKGSKALFNTLIVSPPKCGKTTLLRDIARETSGNGLRVGIVDERSEINAGGYDLGQRIDVLDGCPKDLGITMMIRAMAPDVIITDEIGKSSDVRAIESAICAGVAVVTTIHGDSYEDIRESQVGIVLEKAMFKRVIFLTKKPTTGTINRITDEKGTILYGN